MIVWSRTIRGQGNESGINKASIRHPPSKVSHQTAAGDAPRASDCGRLGRSSDVRWPRTLKQTDQWVQSSSTSPPAAADRTLVLKRNRSK